MPVSFDLPKLDIPPSCQYIGAFLTMACNLSCGYCINKPDQSQDRRKLYPGSKIITPDEWIAIFNRIPFNHTLPITLQGGEPTLYWHRKGIGEILAGTNHYYDLLTNFVMPPDKFVASLNGHKHKLMRGSIFGVPYQSIRVSYHAQEMKRIWEDGIDELVRRCEALREYGFEVSADREKTDVCIHMVAHPENETPTINGDVLFTEKPFLGVHNGILYGDYLYPHSTDLIERGIHHETLQCECRTKELLIDPVGDVWDCHYHLYQHWLGRGDYKPVGNMLDPEFSMERLAEFRPCNDYGRCIGCDTKRKNNRFMDLEFKQKAHTSCEIRNIQWPKGLP